MEKTYERKLEEAAEKLGTDIITLAVALSKDKLLSEVTKVERSRMKHELFLDLYGSNDLTCEAIVKGSVNNKITKL